MGKPGQSSPAAPSADAASELGRLRERIDAIDDEILDRLNARARVVQEVGALKERVGGAVFSQARERDIVGRLAAASPGPFPEAGLAPVFREIISATRSLEEPVRVGYLGPEGTFSHVAAREQFGELAALRPQASLGDVFDAVERGKVELGVVPVENTTDGIVTQSYDRLPSFQGTLCGELLLRISHDLLSRSGRLEDVTRVVSHPQPLAQCREWLDANLSHAERHAVASNAKGARRAAKEEGSAAIAGMIAAEIYGIAPIATNIEDQPENTTRFLVIGHESVARSGDDKSSLLVSTHNRSGALARLLEPLARHGVSMTRIESRPSRRGMWDYVFFIDIEGHTADETVAEALKELEGEAKLLRVLGSYPRAVL